jgi:hypothetical protein
MDVVRAMIVAAAVLLLTATAHAQPQPTPSGAQPTTWDTLPRMQLERQFAGPLRDTIVQRWRDAASGMVCYIYLPIQAQHTPPSAAGYVQYGPNTIGSISCLSDPAATTEPKAAATPPPANAKPAR